MDTSIQVLRNLISFTYVPYYAGTVNHATMDETTKVTDYSFCTSCTARGWLNWINWLWGGKRRETKEEKRAVSCQKKQRDSWTERVTKYLIALFFLLDFTADTAATSTLADNKATSSETTIPVSWVFSIMVRKPPVTALSHNAVTIRTQARPTMLKHLSSIRV